MSETARIAAATATCVYRSFPAHYTSRPDFFFLHAGCGRLPEARMRAEAQKLSDEIKEAFALLRRSL